MPTGRQPAQLPQSAMLNQMNSIKEKIAVIDFVCPRCKHEMKLQANLEQHSDLKTDYMPFPVEDNMIQCPNCNLQSNIISARLQVEALTHKKIVK